MTEISKKLNSIINEMELMKIDSCDEKISLQKKTEFYNRSIFLLTEAKKLFDELDQIILIGQKKSDINNDKLNITQIENSIGLLSKKNASVTEICNIIEKLWGLKQNIPTSGEIIDNVETHAVCEEFDIL